ncbi:MAG: hypothetical protein H8D95_00120 [Candidatus Endolissoclinum sp.]|jgi:hypothetical protein|nr:hypothetical protein [Candidatus Endolissoclinum sp.]
MAKFREFYVQAGAGSNFLARHCLWNNNIENQYGFDEDTNEYHVQRDRTPADIIKLERNNGWEADELLRDRTAEIIPVLKSIHAHLVLADENKWDYPFSDKVHADNREELLNNRIDRLWREDVSLWTVSFIQPFYNCQEDIPEEIRNQIEEVQRYFTQCREYYFTLCEENNWNVDLITHLHPYETYSSLLTLPHNFKSLAMEVDDEVNLYVCGLLDIKVHNIQPEYYIVGKGETEDNKFWNRSVNLSDDSVSYRKIFFENDRYEIMKMYEFFDNRPYFNKNRVQIMKEFREYHDNNMELIKKFIPSIYRQIKSR